MEVITKLRYNSAINGGAIMPIIKSSAELRNNYSKVSEICHKYNEPVFITKNGQGDLAVMSMETYELMAARYELYSLLEQGKKDIDNGETIPLDEAMDLLRKRKEK